MKTKRKYTVSYVKNSQELHERVAYHARRGFYKTESFPWGEGVFAVFEEGRPDTALETFVPTGKQASAGTHS